MDREARGGGGVCSNAFDNDDVKTGRSGGCHVFLPDQEFRERISVGLYQSEHQIVRHQFKLVHLQTECWDKILDEVYGKCSVSLYVDLDIEYLYTVFLPIG